MRFSEADESSVIPGSRLELSGQKELVFENNAAPDLDPREDF